MSNIINYPHFAVYGGGTSGATAAGIIDAMPEARVTAIVGTADEGSCTGDLRRLYGIPAVGDIRRSISALSNNSYAAALMESRFDTAATTKDVADRAELLAAAVSYASPSMSNNRRQDIIAGAVDLGRDVELRSPRRLGGMSLGHLVLASLTLEHDDIGAATAEACRLMTTRGIVIPSSLSSHTLIMRDGLDVIRGEEDIDNHVIRTPDDTEVWIESIAAGRPEVRVNPAAVAATLQADKIVLSSGSVYTSLIPSLLPIGVTRAIAEAQDNGASISMIGNLVTEATETSGWKAERYVQEAERYLGRRLDEIVVNEATDKLPEGRAVTYDRELLQTIGGYLLVVSDFVEAKPAIYDPNDPLTNRSSVQHDMTAVGRAVTANLRHTTAAA